MAAVPGNFSSGSGVKYLTLLHVGAGTHCPGCLQLQRQTCKVFSCISPQIFHIAVGIKAAPLALESFGAFGYLKGLGVALVAQFPL